METLAGQNEQEIVSREYERQKDMIAGLNSELDSFAYSVSHDLKAPLRAVIGFARVLDEEYGKGMDAEARRLLKTVITNADRMGELMDAVLIYSRAGRKSLVLRPLDMNDIAASAVSEVCREKDAAIEVQPLHDIVADSALIHQVLVALLENALKFTSKMDAPLIKIWSEQQGSDIVFAIGDNGVGFDMKYADRLFGIFQRMHTEQEFPGVGAGLATTRRIISRHGGKTWISAAPGAGTTIYFSIPLA